MNKRRWAQNSVVLFLALAIVFTPFIPRNPLAPTPAKASLGDCWDAVVDATKYGLEDMERVLSGDFLKCAGQLASMDVVSIAVDATFTIWGATGKFNDTASCNTAVKETIVQPLFDLFSMIPADVKSFIDSTILAVASLVPGIIDLVNDVAGFNPPITGPLTLDKLLAAGVDKLYELLKQAVPTVFDYINCGCTFAGTTLVVARHLGEVAKEGWQCAQSFCIVNCDDNPPYPPGVWQACAPGDRKWYNPGSVPGDGPFYESFGCNGCAAGSTLKTYSDFTTVTDTNWYGKKIQKQKEIARYDYCACPAGEGYQQDGMVMGDYADSKGNKTGGQALVANYACKPCPPGAFRDLDGKSCIKCGAGKGVYFLPQLTGNLPICGNCAKGQGTLADGTCGICVPGEGVFAGTCGQCPESAPRNKDGVCEGCPPGTRFDPVTGICHPICTGGKVWKFDSKEVDGCEPCSKNTEAVYTLYGEPTGGQCPECERGWASTAGQVCKELDCQCMGADGHSCTAGVMVSNTLDGKHPVYACSATVEVPLKDPCPECRSKGAVPKKEWKMDEIRVQKEKPAEKYKTLAPTLDLPGGSFGTQSPKAFPSTRPGGGGFKTQ